MRDAVLHAFLEEREHLNFAEAPAESMSHLAHSKHASKCWKRNWIATFDSPLQEGGHRLPRRGAATRRPLARPVEIHRKKRQKAAFNRQCPAYCIIKLRMRLTVNNLGEHSSGVCSFAKEAHIRVRLLRLVSIHAARIGIGDAALHVWVWCRRIDSTRGRST